MLTDLIILDLMFVFEAYQTFMSACMSTEYHWSASKGSHYAEDTARLDDVSHGYNCWCKIVNAMET